MRRGEIFVDPDNRETVVDTPSKSGLGEVFAAFLRLGISSFGGPIAHIVYLRHEFVERRGWIEDTAYADLVALCQFLPGPASSKVGIAIGILRHGLAGGFAAWLGFTLPSALALIAFGYGISMFGDMAGSAWVHGLKLAAVAVVAQAVWGMAKNLCPDRQRVTVAAVSAMLVLAWPTAMGQISAIVAGGLIGWWLLPAQTSEAHVPLNFRVTRAAGVTAWVIFFVVLLALPPLAKLSDNHALAMFDSFYRSGSLVFGGGHVVLPLLRAEVVPPGWVSDDVFLAGYGAAQAVPGPLFTFAAYLGTVMQSQPNGWLGGLLCLIAIFTPSFLLSVGSLPFWESLRDRAPVQRAMRGINAAVVGLLLGALYDPVWTSAVHTHGDFALVVAGFVLLLFWGVSPLYVVGLMAAGASASMAFS